MFVERAFGPNFRPKMALRTLLGTNKLQYSAMDELIPAEQTLSTGSA